MNARVLCIGNELAADDGVGIRVGRILRRLQLPPGVEVVLQRTVGFELLDTFESNLHLIVVDASVMGREPGTCAVMQLRDVEQEAQMPLCLHGVGIPELLQVAQRVQPERVPRRIDVMGIEALVLDRFETRLSSPVRDALPAAVGEVLRLLGADEGLRAAGEKEASRFKGWDPDPLEAVSG